MTRAVHRIAKYSSQSFSLLFSKVYFHLSLLFPPTLWQSYLASDFSLFYHWAQTKNRIFNPLSFFSFCLKFFFNYSPLSLFPLFHQFSLFLTTTVDFTDFFARNQDGQHLSASHLANQRTEASVCKYVLFCIGRDPRKLRSITIIYNSVIHDCYDS